MHATLLQDWTTLNGPANGTIVQGASGWLDVGGYQDLVFWLDCRNASVSPVSLSYETAPRQDGALFTKMVDAVDMYAASTSGNVLETAVLAHAAKVPAARWVRWSITAGSAWSVTFRIYVTGSWVGD